jgi:hypothetical protein
MPNNTPTQQAVDKEMLFMTENYGGLNLESSPMNMPFTDSPSVTNVEIEPSGKIKKRRGSKVVADFMEYTDIHIPYRLGNGKLIHIITDRDTIRVLDDGYSITSSTDARVLYSTGLSLVSSPAYTFKSNYSPKRTYLVVKENDTTKFHFFTKNAVPVTLEITEILGTFEYTSGVTHHVVPTSGSNFFTTIDQTKPASAYFMADSDGLWRKGDTYTANYLHLADETGTLTSSSPKSTTGTIVHFNWSWEADVQWRTKGHFEYNFKRFNVAVGTDNSIELSPEMKVSIANDYSLSKELMWDMSAAYNGFANTYPALMAGEIASLSATAPQTYAVSHIQPCIQTDNAFTWIPTFGETARSGKLSSSGNQSGSVSEFQIGLTHIFWGGLYYADAGYTVPFDSFSYTLLKLMGVYVGGGVGEVANNLEFISKETVQTMHNATGFTDTRSRYKGHKKSATAGRIDECTNLATDVIRFYSFTCGSPVGCTGIDTTLTYIPSSLVATGCVLTGTYPSKEAAKSRNFVGLYPWINWKYYKFFSVSTLFQDRVTLAGFELDPSVILLGNTGNQTQIYSGAKYSNFEVNWADSTLATAPVEIRLTMEADERITSMIQWHDSLFVGTTRKLYRVHGGQNYSVTPTNYFVDNVATVPCAYRSMVLTNDGVVFLSDSGVYRVGVDTNSGQFRVDNIGIKIRKALRTGLDKGRLFNGLGRVAYDSINNVIYVLVGDETSLTPRRCFVYFADKSSWVEWTLASGYFPATTVTCFDGRVFFTLSETEVSDNSWSGTEKLAATLTEFNISDSYLDLVKTSTLDDTTVNVHIKLPVPKASYTKAALPTGTKAHFELENPTTGVGIKPLPISYLGYSKVTNTTDTTVGIEGTDFVYAKNNSITTSATFQGHSEVVQVEITKEDDLTPMYIKDATTGIVVPLSALTYNVPATSVGYHAMCSNGDAYDGVSVSYGLAYPCWWLSPAFTRNNIQNLKRMSHFYAVFENSSSIQTNSTTAPSWVTTPKMNLAVVQNGSRTGQSSTAITDDADPTDILSTSDTGLDYYRVVYPIDGNFISFQAFVYSFDDGNWELVGYQLETDVSGRTSRKPYD